DRQDVLDGAQDPDRGTAVAGRLFRFVQESSRRASGEKDRRSAARASFRFHPRPAQGGREQGQAMNALSHFSVIARRNRFPLSTFRYSSVFRAAVKSFALRLLPVILAVSGVQAHAEDREVDLAGLASS